MGDNGSMRLVIQIPCLNEEETLPATLAELPRSVPGFDEVLWLVIDDGSTDRTSEVARECGVDHVVRFSQNKGLAVAFQAGLDAALKLGADAVVNTDADNQYQAADITDLVAPIVEGRADFVVGTRDIADHPEFSWAKKRLQKLGSWVVRRVSGTDVEDATSGFRAYSREAALQVNVVSSFTYTLETVIQAGKSDVAVTHVPIRINPATRDSRLFTSKRQYIRRSVGTISRVYAMYEPLRVFTAPAILFGLVGTVLFARYGWFVLQGDSAGHVQSLVVGGASMMLSLQLFMLGVIGHLQRVNRVIGERTLRRVRAIELAVGVAPESGVLHLEMQQEPDRDQSVV
jgi:glycosyltransferase involved in cell wall biosynthesis